MKLHYNAICDAIIRMNKDAIEPLPKDVNTLQNILRGMMAQLELQSNQICQQSRKLELKSKTILGLAGDLELQSRKIHSQDETIQSLQQKSAGFEAELSRNARELELKSKTIDLQSKTILEQAEKEKQILHHLEKLIKQIYGRRSERFVDPNQLMLFDEDDLKALEQEARDRQVEEKRQQLEEARNKGCKKRVGHGRRPLPGHLPRQVIRHELPADQLPCPCCGKDRAEMGFESSEQLEYVPAIFKVLEHRRIKYACRSCQEHVKVAEVPGKPIEKGLPGPGLLAHVVLGKYGDHLPLYRLEDIAARSGVILRRSTLCGWMSAASEILDPLYQRMLYHVLKSQVIHTDDTTVTLLDRSLKSSRKARFWAYLGDALHPYIYYHFTDSRKRDGPAGILAGYSGYLQADAYSGYDGIYAGDLVHEVACWAHARRKWDDCRTTDPVRSHHMLALIQRLYAIERDLEGCSVDWIERVRRESSLPVLEEIRQWLEAEKPSLLPKSPAGQAATYMLNQWSALERYCESGILAIDNNAAERMMRPIAVGRKGWLFVGSLEGGRRAAILMSLVQTCKHVGVEPWAYLRDLFEKLPRLGPNPKDEDLDRLLADRWLIDHPEHVWEIDRIRKAERSRRQHSC